MWLWFKAGCFQVVSTCKYMQIYANISKISWAPPSNQQEYVDIRCYLKPRNQDHPRLPYPPTVLETGIDFHQAIWRPIQGRGMSWEFHGSHHGCMQVSLPCECFWLSYHWVIFQITHWLSQVSTPSVGY